MTHAETFVFARIAWVTKTSLLDRAEYQFHEGFAVAHAQSVLPGGRRIAWTNMGQAAMAVVANWAPVATLNV